MCMSHVTLIQSRTLSHVNKSCHTHAWVCVTERVWPKEPNVQKSRVVRGSFAYHWQLWYKMLLNSYCNSPWLYLRLKHKYSVISVKFDSLPGNSKKWGIDLFVAFGVRLVHSWADCDMPRHVCDMSRAYSYTCRLFRVPTDVTHTRIHTRTHICSVHNIRVRMCVRVCVSVCVCV